MQEKSLVRVLGSLWFFLVFSFAMAEDRKFRIEKFNGTDFAWWRMQIEVFLGECELDVVLEEKPAGMDKVAEAIWNSKDKKARGKITLALTKSVAFNIMKKTIARSMLTALSNMYEKPSADNRMYLMRELFNMRMNEGSPVADHINEVNSVLPKLATVGMKFDDDTQAVILLSSLADSWSGFVKTVTEIAGTGNLKFDRIRDSVLGEDIRRRNSSGGSTSGMFSVSRRRGKTEAVGVVGKACLKLGRM
ncbi:putative RNA-directed DNA polymerase [Helianthus annuus]|nr:putative RNA-directed DNA polymerase [Helianthus annuus]